jgi:hypothetical protein
MANAHTVVDRIKTPPNTGPFWRRFWFILGAFFLLAFLFEAFQWSRGRGEPSLIASTAGFVSVSAFSFSKGRWMRIVFFLCATVLLIASLLMRLVFPA